MTELRTIESIVSVQDNQTIASVNRDKMLGDKSLLFAQEELFNWIPKIQELASILHEYDQFKGINTPVINGQVVLQRLAENSKTGKDQWVNVKLKNHDEYKAAKKIHTLLQVQLANAASRAGIHEDVNWTPKENPLKRKVSFTKRFPKYFSMISGLGVEGWGGLMSLWGVFQPVIEGFRGDLFDLSGYTWGLISQINQLPVIGQGITFSKETITGLYKKYHKGEEWSLRSALLNVLPDENGITLNKEKRAEAIYSQFRASVSTAGYAAGIVAKALAWASVGGATTAAVSIGGYVLLTSLAVLGTAYYLFQIYNVHRFEHQVTKRMKSADSYDMTKKMQDAFGCLLDRSSITKEDLEKIEKEAYKTPFYHKVLHINKTPLERYEDKLERLHGKKKSKITSRSGIKTYRLIYEEGIKRMNAQMKGEEYTLPSFDDQKRVITQMKSECRWKQIEMAVKALISLVVVIGYIFVIASIASGQMYLIAVSFGFFAIASALGLFLGGRAFHKYRKTKATPDPMETLNTFKATLCDGHSV